MLSEYEMTRNGITFTVKMDRETAKRLKLKPVEKGRTPQNKGRGPANKAANNVAPARK